jgi:hypothetical protein
MTLWDVLEDLSKDYPWATYLVDTKNDESHHVIAAMSRRPQYRDTTIVSFYAYNYENGRQLVAQVTAAAANMDWKSNVALLPVVQLPPFVTRLRTKSGFAALPSRQKFDRIFRRAITWVNSLFEQGLRIFAVGLPFNTIGERYDIETGTAVDKDGNVVTDEELLDLYREDRVLMDLYRYLRAKHPTTPLRGLVRGPDYEDNCGERGRWDPLKGSPQHWAKLGPAREASATPGLLQENGFRFDIMVVDQFDKCLRAEWNFAQGKASVEDFRNPDLTIQTARRPPFSPHDKSVGHRSLGRCVHPLSI